MRCLTRETENFSECNGRKKIIISESTLIECPPLVIFLDYTSIGVGVPNIKKFRIAKTVGQTEALDLWGFISFAELPAKCDVCFIRQAGVTINCYSESEKLVNI